MKNEIIFGIIGSCVVVALAIFFGWKYDNTQNSYIPTTVPSGQYLGAKTTVGSPSVGDVSQTSMSGQYTVSDVSKHGTRQDCWMIVSGRVYDMTNYLSAHPGGARTITPYCGADGTQAFEGQHSGSRRAGNDLVSLYAGDLKN